MGKLTFQATNANYDVLALQSNIPAGTNVANLNFDVTFTTNRVALVIDNWFVNITLGFTMTFAEGGDIRNPNNYSELFIAGVTDIEVSNNADIKLKNYDPVQNIIVDSGSLNFNNHYQNPNGAPVQFNLTLNNGGKFINNINSSLNSIENIGQITMAAGTVFEFDTTHYHYSITAPRDNFVLNDLANIARIAEFIDSKFNNSISDPSVENNKFQGLREYANYQNKDTLVEFIEMNFDVNCQAVDNFINDNALCIRGIETDLSDSYLGTLTLEVLALVNHYAGI